MLSFLSKNKQTKTVTLPTFYILVVGHEVEWSTQVLESNRPAFKSSFSHLLYGCVWVSSLTLLSFHFSSYVKGLAQC